MAFYVLDFRDANRGGPVVPGRITHGTEFDLRHQAAITFLFHGYNVTRDEGHVSLQRLAAALPALAGQALIAVLWPGDHWTRALSYSFEGKDADDTAKELVRYIDRVISPGTRLSFVSHSLGARVAMETLSRLDGRPYPISDVCLMAAAIDDFGLAHPKVYRDATATCRRLAVLASRRDKVLRFAYPAGDLLQAFIFFSKDQSGLALGYHGPRPHLKSPVGANVLHEQIPERRNASHGDYVPAPAPNAEQLSAAAYANAALSGGTPRYV
jgi:hypothetical protein